MGKANKPRSGSLQVWPRVRAKRNYARVKAWAQEKEAKPLGFAGYKVGMATITYTETRSTSPMKGRPVALPVTILECPPLKVHAVAYYAKTPYGIKKITEVVAGSNDKHLAKKINVGKAKAKAPESFDDVRLVVYTQPSLTGIGQKKPELFEVGLGGSKEEKAAKATELLGKEIKVEDVFSAGAQVDTHAITKGYGTQGPVKRNGVSLRRHKSEKGTRGPANLGGWTGNRSWTVAHAGQTGYHTRTEYNKHVVDVSADVSKVTRDGGIMKYGNVKNSYVLLRGSVGGAKKRLVRFNSAIRPNKKIGKAPEVEVLVQ